MTDTNTLSPCPFCGARAETDFILAHHSYQIECSDFFGCTARVTRDSELGAIEAWNLRTDAEIDASARFKAQHEFLLWNREQTPSPIESATEYSVFNQAVDFYLAARAAQEGK